MKPAAADEIQGVLFDWDGTLLDSYAADSTAYLAMFREMGISWGLEELDCITMSAP
jgi:beta-phosphoglucomutase-like phosphatase (HAD superfamily)